MRLTELPVDWDDSKLRWLFRVDSGDQISSEKTVDDGYPLVGGNGTRGYVPEWNTRGPLIVVGRVGALCGNVHEYGGRIWASEHALRLFPRSSFCLRYFTYALESAALNQLALGTAQPVIAASRLGEERLPVPPLPTQRAIASFLDRETEKIDTLIEKKRRLLDLLEEKRTALITRAVTRGLDPDVPMKDSGVEWLGEIPEHWEVAKVKHVARLESGHTPSRNVAEYWVDCDVPWVTLADVGKLRSGDSEYIEDTKEKVSELGLKHSSARRLPANTVVLSRTASVGFAGIMRTPMATSQDFANWICGPVMAPSYLLYVFRGMRHEFDRLMMGSTHQTIYMPDIRRLRAPVPPRREQEAIVDHIRASTGTLQRVRQATSRAVSLLQEYRTSLISHAVTGKIELAANHQQQRSTE